jgi:hypothetical protein
MSNRVSFFNQTALKKWIIREFSPARKGISTMTIIFVGLIRQTNPRNTPIREADFTFHPRIALKENHRNPFMAKNE